MEWIAQAGAATLAAGFFTAYGTSIVGAAVAVFGAGMALRGAARVSRARTWGSTTGRVIESGTARSSNVETEVGEVRAPVHGARVVYEYAVNGARFRSSRVKVGGDVDTSDADRAREIASRYPVGETVTVWYDPARPDRAALELDSSDVGLGVLIALGGVIFAAGPLVATALAAG